MISAAAALGRRIAGFAGLARNDAGMAAVEFSLILPILVLLWIGGVEVTEALSVDRRLNNLASSIGDLVARNKIVTVADINSIFDIGPKAMFPSCKTAAACTSAGLGMRITAVTISAAQNATVAWSSAQGVTAYNQGTNMNSQVPLTLRVANTQVIMSETYYTYTPAVGYVITGDLHLNDRMYFVPRLVAKVQRCTSNPPPVGCVS